jgi:hypothetical protein
MTEEEFTDTDRYIAEKVRQNPFFLTGPHRRSIRQIMKEDFEKDPEFWGDKKFGTKTVREIIKKL